MIANKLEDMAGREGRWKVVLKTIDDWYDAIPLYKFKDYKDSYRKDHERYFEKDTASIMMAITRNSTTCNDIATRAYSSCASYNCVTISAWLVLQKRVIHRAHYSSSPPFAYIPTSSHRIAWPPLHLRNVCQDFMQEAFRKLATKPVIPKILALPLSY